MGVGKSDLSLIYKSFVWFDHTPLKCRNGRFQLVLLQVVIKGEMITITKNFLTIEENVSEGLYELLLSLAELMLACDDTASVSVGHTQPVCVTLPIMC